MDEVRVVRRSATTVYICMYVFIAQSPSHNIYIWYVSVTTAAAVSGG